MSRSKVRHIHDPVSPIDRDSLYLETALHVSGGTSINHQERIQLYLQHLVFVTPLLLSAAIVEEFELVRVCCGWRRPLCHN